MVQLTDTDIDELAAATCPHCGAGIAARKRADTKEWVHDQVKTSLGVVKGHTICWASGLRLKYAGSNG